MSGKVGARLLMVLGFVAASVAYYLGTQRSRKVEITNVPPV